MIAGMHHVVWTFSDKVVVQRLAPGPWLRSLFPTHKREYPWPRDLDLSHFLRSVVDKTPAGRGDKWHIGLPLEYFSLVNFSLPQAAGENLDQAVKFALMRHVPFDLSATYTGYRLLDSDAELEIAAVVAQKEMVDPILQALSQTGLTVRSMFPSLVFWALASEDGAYLMHARGQTEIVLSQEGRIPFHLWFRPSAQEDEESFAQRGATLLENLPEKPDTLHVIGSELPDAPGLNLLKSSFAHIRQSDSPPLLSAKSLSMIPYSLSFLSPAVHKQEKAFRILRIAGLAFLLLSLLSLPLADVVGTMRYKDRLQEKVATVHKQVQELEAIRTENQELGQFFEVLAQHMHSQPQSAHILKELTEVMPETAWLYSFLF
jgi:general secretion pathway protein L